VVRSAGEPAHAPAWAPSVAIVTTLGARVPAPHPKQGSGRPTATLNAVLNTPFRIGPVEVPNRVLLAPLAGIGTWFVRLQARRYGAGLAVSEMVSSFAIHHRNDKTMNELLRIHPDEGAVSVQLFGQDPDVMRSAAATVAERGAAIIDLNMGCPVPKVCKTGAGAALIKDPDTAVAVARAAAQGSGLPVTVKLRSGQRPGETDGYALAHRLVEEAGVAAIGFHPRSAAVHHKGVPDYDLAARLVQSLPAPVILTGGLRDRASVLAAYEHTGAAAVMLARGSLGNPWLFEELLSGRTEEPSADEILDELGWMMDAAAEHFGPERAARWMRKAYPWYMERLGAGKAVQASLQATDSLEAANSVLNELRPLLHCPAVPA
jgi:tRNA-dihydrouridine synthase B